MCIRDRYSSGESGTPFKRCTQLCCRRLTIKLARRLVSDPRTQTEFWGVRMRFLACTGKNNLTKFFMRCMSPRHEGGAPLRGVRLRLFTAAISTLVLFGVVLPASGQGIKRILVSRGRVFSEFGPGIAEMKRCLLYTSRCV